MKICHNRTSINISVKKLSPLGKFLGLMFKSKNTKNLLFESKKPVNYSIHSFFVFFRFLAVWLNSKNQILDYKIVCPFTLSIKPKSPFSKLIELPLNKNNQKIIKKLVDKGKV